jgi:hypothetical protein
MRLLQAIGTAAVLFTSAVTAASSWTYSDATLSVAGKGSEASKQKYDTPLLRTGLN